MTRTMKHSGIIVKSILVLVILLMALTNVKMVHAEGNLTIDSQVGYDGQYYVNAITPVFVTLQNNLGRDIKGDLVFNVKNNNGVTSTYAIPVEATDGTTIKATFYVQGYLDKKNNSFQFYEKGIESNKEIVLSGNTAAIGKSVNGEDIVGIVSSDPDTLNFLLFLNQQDYALSNVILKEDFEVESEQALKMFTVLVLNDVATSSWSEKKIESIKKWVAAGGTLVIAGGVNYAETVKPFADIVPVSSGEKITLSDTSVLDDYAIAEVPLGEIIINNGQLTNGTVLLNANNKPIVAKQSIGAGNTYYVAFDLATKPFSIWEGRTSFIQTMLSETLVPVSMRNNYYEDNQSILGNVVQYFPDLKAPSSMLLMLLFALYAIVIAPVIYFILKHKDRREWSWWIIPSGAVIATLIIIFVGALDKRENYLNQVNVVEQANGYMIHSSGNNLFLATNRDIKIDIPNTNNVQFLPYKGEYSESNLASSKTYISRQLADSTQVIWKNNKFWSTRSFVQNESVEAIENQPRIDVQLQNNGDQLEVVITNQTDEYLEHVALLNGSQVITTTDLDIGASATITVTDRLELNYQNYYGNNYFSSIFGSSQAYEEGYRERTLLDNAAFFETGVNLVAFSYSDQGSMKVNNKKVKTDALTMWKVDLNDQLKQLYPSVQYIQPVVEQSSAGSFSKYNGSQFYLEKGSVQLNYHLQMDSEKNATFKLMEDFDMTYADIHVQIYDVTSSTWIDFENELTDVSKYLSENNTIMFNLSTDNGYEGTVPTLYVKGEQ